MTLVIVNYTIKNETLRASALFSNANAIKEFKAAVTDQATYECISCKRLLRRKSVMQAKNMKGSVWNRLMSFKLLNDPSSLQNKVLYIYTNCKTIIKMTKYQDVVY